MQLMQGEYLGWASRETDTTTDVPRNWASRLAMCRDLPSEWPIRPVPFAAEDAQDTSWRAAASTSAHGPTAALRRETSLPSAALQKIPLHIDDDERYPAGSRLRFDDPCGHGSLKCRSRTRDLGSQVENREWLRRPAETALQRTRFT
jgi:hypothetical protein